MNKELRIKEKLKIANFKDLTAWQKAHFFVLQIYEITRDFPREEQFGLTNQLRRAAVSITSNIAEGFSRASYREKSQFYSMALGSLTEIQSQLSIAKDLGYLKENVSAQLDDLAVEIHKILNGLIKSSRSFILTS